MITVKLMGGLGNQMFQYAAALGISANNHAPIQLDLTFLNHRLRNTPHVFRNYDLDIFNISPRTTLLSKVPGPLRNSAFRVSRVLTLIRKITRTRIVLQDLGDPYGFNAAVSNAPADCYLDGYWQNLDYFSHVESEVRRSFTSYNDDLCPRAASMLTQIQNVDSVCINYRRTDYVNNASASGHHANLGSDFYNVAVEHIKTKVPDPRFFIFSDDIDWCRANVRTGLPTTFVGHDCAGRKFSSYLRLMSACQHFIIPNSTFAFWAAWLSASPRKCVVAPRYWLTSARGDVSASMPRDWRLI